MRESPETIPGLPEKFLRPEVVYGLNVYGLSGKIMTESQILRLYGHLDEKFAVEKGITVGDKTEQRKELLNPNERYLEVVVRQSAYDSFLDRQEETKVNFVEWIRMHVDASWAIANDYRVDTWRATDQGYFWSVFHKNGKTFFGKPPGVEVPDMTYQFPEKNDSLRYRKGVWLDFGLTHEWSHYLMNLPDQSSYNIHDKNPSRFANFLVVTGNNFQEPYLSPYLSMFLSENIRRKTRSGEQPYAKMKVDGTDTWFIWFLRD
ncbi:MAG: hypothetical protein Q8P91_01945 [bacterium]|nr:hypothetical protein [bacterium]